MADVFSKKKRSQVMAAIRSKRNKDTELRLISIFRENGISGWRRNEKLVGKPDFVFRKKKVVVFVDGCFWHYCPTHGRIPSSNSVYWLKKLQSNRRRDRKISMELKKAGWGVLRLWEHELSSSKRTAKRVNTILKKSTPFL